MIECIMKQLRLVDLIAKQAVAVSKNHALGGAASISKSRACMESAKAARTHFLVCLTVISNVALIVMIVHDTVRE